MLRFVNERAARRLIDDGAVVVDARKAKQFRTGHLPGAALLDWTRLRDGRGRTGRITDDDGKLAARFGELGMEPQRPVLVYGAGGEGAGQEGRIAWMFSYLGAQDVAILDGGFATWQQAELPVEAGRRQRSARSIFQPRRDERLRATAEDMLAAAGRSDAAILDVRSGAEWEGGTPHLEPRGGRIPTARHLEWTRLLGGDGRLLPAAEIEAQLARVGIRRQDEIEIYCTGGVRSAFVWAVLTALGWPRVRMYDGSFFEWSKRDLPIEHERRPVGRRVLKWAGGLAAVILAAGMARRLAARRA